MYMEAADSFFHDLQLEAIEKAQEFVEDVPAAAQRLWTSAKRMRCALLCLCS